MTVTGNFKNGHIDIPRVTGDIVITINATNNTTPIIKFKDKYYWSNSPYIFDSDSTANGNYYCCTIGDFPVPEYTGTKNITHHIPKTEAGKGGNLYFVGLYNGEITSWGTYGCVNYGTDQSVTNSTNIGGNSPINAIAVGIRRDIALDDIYAYMTETGQVLFAGINTPYYGKKNIGD